MDGFAIYRRTQKITMLTRKSGIGNIKESIIYEDEEIIVCHKSSGIATQTSKTGEQDMESLLKNYLKSPYIGIVHRLDQPVEGLLVFAKNKQAAAELSRQNAGTAMSKKYYAVVVTEGKCMDTEIHTLTDYLIKNGKENTSRVAGENEKGSKDAKKAELSYEVIKVREGLGKQDAGRSEDDRDSRILRTALARITLKTGRHHQIRVQMAHAGMPLLGDMKYGNQCSKEISRAENIRNVALCACSLTFFHPKTGRKMNFEIEPSGEAFAAFFPVNS